MIEQYRFGLNKNLQEMVHAQKQQVWVRIILACMISGYIIAHAPMLMQHLQLGIASLLSYCAFHLLSLGWISRRPEHLLRLLAAPLWDICLICLGMWLDGGISSPLYILFFIVIVGNGLRFGNMLLLYSQILSLLGLACVALLNVYSAQQSIDWLYLMLQLVGIILVPGYTYLIGLRLDKALSARAQVEQDSVGLLDASPIPAFTYEPDHHGDLCIRYANPAMGRMCNMPQEALHGESVVTVCVAEDIDAMRDGCAKVLLQVRPETVHSFDVRSKNQRGDLRHLMCQASSLRWGGHLMGLCLMTDVTENERMHDNLEAVHRQEYINSVLAGMAHDFRNVLTNIVGTAEVMQMTASDPSVIKSLDVIMDSGEKGSEMINHLHHLMRGRKARRSFINLQDSLYAAVNLARMRMPHHISLTCSIDDDLPPLLGYQAQIDQMVILLIDNAAHAIKGSGRIEVYVEKDRSHALAQNSLPALRIRINDTGCGISAADLPHVFEAFWSTRKDQNAAGLGLSMVQRIIHWHHGSIELNSKPGKGTSVIIHLPATNEAQHSNASQPAIKS